MHLWQGSTSRSVTPKMLLLRRFRSLRHYQHHRRCCHHVTIPKLPFSSLSSPQNQSPTSNSIPQPGSLSARMSFVFEQIDAIEKERAEKDQTLQRIRAWRESKRQSSATDTSPAASSVSVASSEPEPADSGEHFNLRKDESEGNLGLLNGKRELELVHPWPEWIGLMERLVQQNYFDHKRKDEDGMMENLGFNISEMVAEDGFDFTRDFKTVQTAVLNFGRDRFDILRSLSRQDLQVFVGYGCPSTDKKVVFSAKLLRKLVHLDEGDVCSSCSLRSSCERAYLLTNKEDEARTIDVMRVLLTYGFDAVNGSVTNRPLLKMKALKTVVRRLLHEVVKLSSVPIDPNLPPPVIKKPPPKVKQPPPPPKKRVGRDDIEMKKGDWLCPKCDFMNFAKNTICLQCDAKRPKRQLLPGEWECPQCNFLNYRRNMVCFHCEHKRPPDDFVDHQVQERQHSPRRLEKVPDRREFSNAWNFDFDDNESDGADVATFEYADSQTMHEDFPLNKGSGHEDGYSKGSQHAGIYDKEMAGHVKPGFGFNDFDDEDDDLDSYELDTQSGGQKSPRVNFSELEVESISEDEETRDRPVSNFHAKHKPSPKSSRRPLPLSGYDNEIDFGSGDDLPVHPNWKSSHVAQFDQRNKRRGAMSFGSDDELSSDLDDGEEDFASRKKKGKKWSSSSYRRGGNSDFENESFADSESNNNTRFGSKGRLGIKDNLRISRRGGRNFDFDDSDFESNGNARSGFANKGDKQWNHRRQRNSDTEEDSFSDVESSNRGPFGKVGFRNKGSQHKRGNLNFDSKRNSKEPLRRSSYGSQERNGSTDFQKFRSSRREGSYTRQRSGNQRGDSYLDDDRFKRPRVNVR